MTSRLGEITRNVQRASVFQICPLTEDQINIFAKKWINNDDLSNSFIQSLKETPLYDTSLRPLTLAHLCTLYERKRQIPEKSTILYDKIINLLLEEWDAQRAIVRESKFDHFSIYEKKEFLSELAFNLTTKLEVSSFTKEHLRDAYNDIAEGYFLPFDEVETVIDEIESHTGLFVQSGYKTFQFSHKSLQEFLTAEFITKLPDMPKWQIMKKLPSESALLVNLSSKPTEQFAKICFEVTLNIISNEVDKGISFFVSFIERIYLEKARLQDHFLYACSILVVFTAFIRVKEKYSRHEIWKMIEEDEFFILSLRKLTDYYSLRDERQYLPTVEMYRQDVDQKYIKYMPSRLVTKYSWLYKAI